MYRWIGGQSADWTNPSNWQEKHATTGQWVDPLNSYPGLGTVDDEALFDGNAVRNCVLNRTQTTLADFEMRGGFGPRFVTVSPGATLQVKEPDPGPLPVERFSVRSGTLEVLGSGNVELRDCAGLWDGGSINNLRDARPDTSPGTLLVGENASLDIRFGATDLGVNLGIGGGEVESTVTISDMNQNLQLWHGASVTVYADGLLRLNQSADSATKGGIVKRPDSAASVITNYGEISRGADAKDGDGPVYLRIEPRVTNGAGGLFKMSDRSSIAFVSGFHNNGGTLDMKRARVQLPPLQKLTQTAGVIQLRGVGLQSQCLFDGEVEVPAGSLFVGENQDAEAPTSNFVTMQVTKDLTLGAGAEVYLSADLNQSGRGDFIRVTGKATIDNADVSVTVLNNSWEPPDYATYREYDLLIAGTVAGPGWWSEHVAGDDPPGSWTPHAHVLVWVGTTYRLRWNFAP